MGERMIPNLMSLPVSALHYARELVGLQSDHEKCRGRLLALEHVEDLGRPRRIGAIVKGQRHLVRTVAVAPYTIGFWQRLKILIRDQIRCGVDDQIACSRRWALLNTKNFPL